MLRDFNGSYGSRRDVDLVSGRPMSDEEAELPFDSITYLSGDLVATR
jgi:hypothetical protein